MNALLEDSHNYIVIFPNNDLGSLEILKKYESFEGNSRFKIFPSLRFEYFLTLLNDAEFIIGNSSAGIREAHYYNTPTIDIGSRQNNRAKFPSIFHVDYEVQKIHNAIKSALLYQQKKSFVKHYFGDGNSDKFFLELLKSEEIWRTNCQKQFQSL